MAHVDNSPDIRRMRRSGVRDLGELPGTLTRDAMWVMALAQAIGKQVLVESFGLDLRYNL